MASTSDFSGVVSVPTGATGVAWSMTSATGYVYAIDIQIVGKGQATGKTFSVFTKIAVENVNGVTSAIQGQAEKLVPHIDDLSVNLNSQNNVVNLILTNSTELTSSQNETIDFRTLAVCTYLN